MVGIENTSSLSLVYFCTPVKIGFSTSQIGFWPGGEPAQMVLVMPYVES